MPYRVKPGVPLVCARNPLGKIVYYYANPAKGMAGPNIPWLSDDQAAHLLRLQYIERTDDEAAGNDTDVAQPDDGTPTPHEHDVEEHDSPPRREPTTTPDNADSVAATPDDQHGEHWIDHIANTSRIEECIDALNQLQLPPDVGASTARKRLRDAGKSYSNATIASAVKSRKNLSGTATTS